MHSRSFALGSLSALALLLCSSCSNNDSASRGGESRDATSAPDVSPTAAPGVSFNFNYEFNLPDERISATQEAHAAACEKLGVARCRITGMSYRVDQSEQVTAELDLKLDPMIARQFGKSAQALVESNDGKLIELNIGSADEGSAIEQATSKKNDATARIAALQQELAKTKPGSNAHANLLTQIESLQQQASEQSQAIQTSQAALASTPMEFHYYGRGGVPGFRGNPLREAWQTFVTTVVWIAEIILQALAVLLPLALLLGLLIAVWRTRPVRVVRQWFKGSAEAEE